MAANSLNCGYFYKIPLLFICFICFISIVNSSLLIKYTRVMTLTGKICKTEDTSFTKTGIDSFLCALLCVDRDDCFGTFYSKRESMCVGCCKFYNTSLDLEEFEKDATANYDFKKSPNCDEVGKELEEAVQGTDNEIIDATEDNTLGITTDIWDNISVEDGTEKLSNYITKTLIETTENDKSSLEGNANGDAIIDISTRAMDNSQESANGDSNDDITAIGTTVDTFDTTIHEVDDNSETSVDISTDSMDASDHRIDNSPNTDEGHHNDRDDTLQMDASTTTRMDDLNSITHATDDLQNLALGTYSTDSTMSATDLSLSSTLIEYSTGSTISTVALSQSSSVSEFSTYSTWSLGSRYSTMSTAALSLSSSLSVYSTGSTMSAVSLSQSSSVSEFSTYSTWPLSSRYSTTAAASSNYMSSTVTYELSTTDSECGCYVVPSTYIYD